jgi:acyl carrier protein
MRDRIRHTMAGVWNVPAAEIPEDADATSLPGWDSMRHLELMLELEMNFGVRIPAEEMPELISIGAIEEALREHGAA